LINKEPIHYDKKEKEIKKERIVPNGEDLLFQKDEHILWN